MSRTNRHRHSASRRLRVERLEDRSLLAVAAFSIELREDLGGVPGEVLAADEVEVGDCFFVEILAQEFHPLYNGLHGVALNIAWDASVLEEIDAGFDLNQLITENLPLFRGGTLDNAAGTIDNLSGSAFHASGIGRAIGNGTAERFALLHFRAESAAAAASIRLSEGASSIVTQPAATFASSQLSFEQQAIAIVAGTSPATTELVESQPEDVPLPEPLTGEPRQTSVEEPANELPPEETTDAGEFIPDETIFYMLGSLAELAAAGPDGEIEDVGVSDEPAGDAEQPASDSEPEPEIFTLGDSDFDSDSAPSTECLAATEFAVAVDAILIGPLTPEQFAAQSAAAQSPHSLRLEDLIALLAMDTQRRREATVLNAVNAACS